jgi:glycosyltransferase involved in cell wall biosynthesis
MKKAFDGFENNCTIVSVSPWLMGRAKESLILKDFEHKVVLNGLDTDIFRPYDTQDIKKELGITNEKIIFHATPSFSADPDHIKGGYYILELAEALKEKNVKVVVAGRYDSNIRVPENVILLGNIPDQKLLAKYYSLADVTVIASKKETFSMIVAESLCCGTPVLGFKAGAPEQIALPQYSSFSKYGDIDALIKNVIDILGNNKNSDEIYQAAEQKYSKEVMAFDYIKVYMESLS